jgi:NADP-dependent 3-hydroxy acid dehydrogenase YdfG
MTALGGALAVVTGSSRGIGAAVAARLEREGARVIRVARTIEPGGAGGPAIVADLADDRSADAAIARILELGVPDIVVSNAGAFALGPLERQSAEELDRLYRINVRAPFLIARAFLPPMRARGSGRHILVGSVSDHRAFAHNAVYATTKFAARGLHEVLREEFQGSGVLCTLISPSAVDTPLWDPLDPDNDPALPSRADMLRPEDVAEAVRWVATLPPSVDVGWMTLQGGKRRAERG